MLYNALLQNHEGTDMILECGHKICIRYMIWNLNVVYIEDFRTVRVKVIHCCTEAQPEALVPSSLVLNR